MVLQCAGNLKPGLSLTTTVIHNYKLLINDVKPDHSLLSSLPRLKVFQQGVVSFAIFLYLSPSYEIYFKSVQKGMQQA